MPGEERDERVSSLQLLLYSYSNSMGSARSIPSKNRLAHSHSALTRLEKRLLRECCEFATTESRR